MAQVIRWYLCPLIPNIDPLGRPIPDTWVESIGGRRAVYFLPNLNFCIIRINADSALLDNLVAGTPPQGFFRLPLNRKWNQLTATQKDFITSRWPSVSISPNNTLSQVIEKLIQQITSDFIRSQATSQELESGIPEE